MYAVSDKYSTAIKENERTSCIVGTMTALGHEKTIDDSILIKDSFYITNRCVNNNKLEFGCVYSAECGFSLLKTKIVGFDSLVLSDYSAKVTFEYRILYSDGTYDSVPLGTFFIDSAVVENGVIKITAIDKMYKLDKEISENISDKWYNCVKRIADVCGLTLAQSKETLDDFHTNTAYTYSIRADKIGSYRDAISNLATVVCAFAYIDRNGKLMFKQFSSTADDTNDKDSRIKGCKVEDYSVTFNAVKARFLANDNYVTYKSESSLKTDGITLDIGDISIVGGTSETKEKILMHIRDTAVNIEYTPMTLYIPSNPAYDLGDMIACENSNNTLLTKKTYVMEYKFEYRSKETIKSFGENPHLQMISDKASSDKTQIENAIEGKNVVTLSAKNTHAVTVKDEEKRILRLKYAATIDCYPVIFVSVQFKLENNGNVYFELHDGSSIIPETKRMGYFLKGTHTQTLAYTKADKKDQITNLDLYMWCEYITDSDIRLADDKINSLISLTSKMKSMLSCIGDVFTHDKGAWINDDKYTLATNYIRVSQNIYYKLNINTGFRICCGVYNKSLELISGYDGMKTDMNKDEIYMSNEAYYIRLYVDKIGTDESGEQFTITTDDLDSIVCTCVPVFSTSISKIDFESPSLSINETDANIIVYSQGIDGDLPWDGTLEFSDSFTGIDILSVDIATFTDTLTTKFITPTPIDNTEKMDAVDIVSVDIQSFDAYVNGEYVVECAVVDANCNDLSYNTKYIDMSSGTIALKQSYTFTSVIDTIDSGKLAVLSIDLSQFNTVESVVIE